MNNRVRNVRPFPPAMEKLKNKIMGPKCFTCSQMRHLQRECPHMECMLVKALKGVQVITIDADKFTRLVVLVSTNGQEVVTLSRCRVQEDVSEASWGACLVEVLQIKAFSTRGNL